MVNQTVFVIYRLVLAAYQLILYDKSSIYKFSCFYSKSRIFYGLPFGLCSFIVFNFLKFI
jgi:hypothetical protein